MGKYRTVNYLMLQMLLEHYQEDVKLSAERLRMLLADGDVETHEIELGSYNRYIEKLEAVKMLIASEEFSTCSKPHTVNILCDGKVSEGLVTPMV